MAPAGKKTVLIHDNHRKDGEATADASSVMNHAAPLPSQPKMTRSATSVRPITVASASVAVIGKARAR